MNTGLLVVILTLADGSNLTCETDRLVTFTANVSEVTVRNCGGRPPIVCRPQQVVTYWPDIRTLDLGLCLDVVFKDGFEEST